MEKQVYKKCPCLETGSNGDTKCTTGVNNVKDSGSIVSACDNHIHNYLSAGWKPQVNWKEEIYKALITVAKREPSFTNDDVFEEFEKTKVYINPDRRSYGNVVQRALKEGIMEWTGSSIVSRRKNCHSMLIRVYKSNIYEYTPVSWFKLFWDKIRLYGRF
jgi:hypothetical protein